jgi:hypothetical protein
VVEVLRNVASTLVELTYGLAYYQFMEEAKALPVWTGSMDILQAADQKGVGDE